MPFIHQSTPSHHTSSSVTLKLITHLLFSKNLHQQLTHSLPTRRSSDLPAAVHHADAVGDGHRLLLVVGDDDEGQARSEEHTSELQSRVDLVCRLLLEKKKKDQVYAQTALHAYHTTEFNASVAYVMAARY